MSPLARQIVAAIAVFLAVEIGLSLLVGPAHCRDGWPSPSIGRQGACSHHRGVDRLPGALVLLAAIGAGAAVVYVLRKRP